MRLAADTSVGPAVRRYAEVTIAGWEVDTILSGPRLRLRRTYAAAVVRSVTDAGFELFTPHYSVVLPAYDEGVARRLLDVLGDVRPNPHHPGRNGD